MDSCPWNLCPGSLHNLYYLYALWFSLLGVFFFGRVNDIPKGCLSESLAGHACHNSVLLVRHIVSDVSIHTPRWLYFSRADGVRLGHFRPNQMFRSWNLGWSSIDTYVSAII